MKKYKFKINGNNYEVVVKDVEDNMAELTVNEEPFTVEIQQDKKKEKTPILIRKEVTTKPAGNKVAEKPGPLPANTRPSSKTIKAPLPGSVLKVLVREGDEFKAGDVLMIMESMKMENNILAEKGGKVIRVCAPAGTTVLQDEALLETE